MTKFDKARKREVRREDKWYMVKWREFCCPFWLYPLIPVALVSKKFDEWNYNRKKWNEKRATRVLNTILPHYLQWDEEKQAYYYDMDMYYWNIYTKAHFYDRAWARKFVSTLHSFVRDGYENDKYIKSEERDSYTIWVKFTEK